jgi:hypothetical protein
MNHALDLKDWFPVFRVLGYCKDIVTVITVPEPIHYDMKGLIALRH